MKENQVRRLERVFKGVSNHWRIKILLIILDNPKITLEGIVKKIKGNYQTTAEHVQRLKIAGLICKKYQGRSVVHNLSPYGLQMIKIIKNFPV